MSVRAFRSWLLSPSKLQTRAVVAIAVCMLFESGPAGAARQAPADTGLVIFGYQRVGEDEYPATSVDFDQFTAQLQELRSGGSTIMPLPQAAEILRSGGPLPSNAVAITLDGGFRSAYEKAVPRLRAARVPFTMFIAPDTVGSPGRIGWAELRDLAKSGTAIGVATASPYHMPLADEAKNIAELNRGIARFRDELGSAPTLFAYPYGSSSRGVRALVAARGFAAAFGQQGGVAHAGSDRLDLPRFMISEEFGSMDRFRLAANALPLPIADLLPPEAVLTENAPNIGFTVPGSAAALGRLSCSGTGQGRLPVQQLGSNRVEIRVREPFEPGRARINCTLPTADGRFRWLGLQFLVPSDSAVEELE